VSAAGDPFEEALADYYAARVRVREAQAAFRVCAERAGLAAAELASALDAYDRCADRLVIAEDLAAQA
jgi:hypothetical protein